MTIDDWLSSVEQDYKTGLSLYEALPTCNKYLLQSIQEETPQNLVILRFQLEKNRHLSQASPVSEKNNISEDVITADLEAKPSFKPTVQIKDLPFNLHPVYIEQKNNFALACSLKVQLNELQDHEIEYKALNLIIKIESLFKSIKAAWKIIDYYIEHGEVIEIGKNELQNLTFTQLYNKRNSLRSSITRQKKRKKNLQTELSGTVLRNEKLKIEDKILKSDRKLLELESSLDFVTKRLSGS